MTRKELFKRLGLPKHADALYETLLKFGPMLATVLAKAARVHRPAAYRALTSLLDQRFVFATKKEKRTYYHAADPEVISGSFAALSAKVEKTIVKKVEKQAHRTEEVRLLEGTEGIREAFDDAVAHTPRGETFYRYTSEKDLAAVNRYLSKNYRSRRDEKKLERLVISNPKSGNQKRPRLERFIKYIPPEFDTFDQNIVQLIYGNRVSLIDLNKERVLIIENKELAQFQKTIFKMLYKKL